jgi:hypothetical protein
MQAEELQGRVPPQGRADGHPAPRRRTSWQHSLKTADPRETAVQRARYTARYENQVIRPRVMLAPDAEAAAAIVTRAQSVVAHAFDHLAAGFGSMEQAVAPELDGVATAVRLSWGPRPSLAQRELMAELAGGTGASLPSPARRRRESSGWRAGIGEAFVS